MSKLGKIIIGIIIGVVAVAAVAGGCFLFLQKDSTKVSSVTFGGQEVQLTNGEQSVKLDLPMADQLSDSPVAVMGFLNLTDEQEQQMMEQREAMMQAQENGEEIPETDIIEDTISGENYDILTDQSINEISVNLKNEVSARYEISDVVYSKDTLENIAEGVKEVNVNGNTFMYTVQNQDDYHFYYIVCNKFETNSIFIVLTSTSELSENNLMDYMNAVQFE